MEKSVQGIFKSSMKGKKKKKKGEGKKKSLKTHYSPQIHHHHSQFCMDLHSNFSKLGCKPAKLTVISTIFSSNWYWLGCTLSSSTVSAHITVGPIPSYLHYEHFDTARTKLLSEQLPSMEKNPLTKNSNCWAKARWTQVFWMCRQQLVPEGAFRAVDSTLRH